MKKIFSETIICKIFETNPSFFYEIVHYGKIFIFYFSRAFASINKTFILAGRRATRLSSFYQV